MSSPYLKLLPINSETSFIDVDYFSVMDPHEQSNTNMFRSLYLPLDFIGCGYVAVPILRLQVVLVVGEGFIPVPLSTSTLSRFLLVKFKNMLD